MLLNDLEYGSLHRSVATEIPRGFRYHYNEHIMATPQSWLETLDQATSYRELQAAFSKMSAAASTTSDPTALAGAIDEAIRRIEQERSRDQAELATFATEYDAFKQQQSGVIGWFKRKLPFTETRRQELQHREAVDDQQAEILADNFVIARAQMLKERILPGAMRRMGHRLDEWQRSILQNDSLQGIREYGNVTYQLGVSIHNGLAFIQSVAGEIDAFARASFGDKEDRSLRDSDIVTARSELKVVQDEVHGKDLLRKSAVKRLSELVHDELVAHDPDFRTLTDAVKQLKEVTARFPTLTKVIEERQLELKNLCAKLAELESIPHKLEALETALRTLKRESEDAEHRRVLATRELEEPSRRYESAMRELQQSKAALKAAKSMYDAYLAEQNQAEVSSASSFQTESPVVAEHERLRIAAAQAETQLQNATPEFERAKSKFEKVCLESDSVGKKMDQQSQSMAKLADTQAQLRSECNAARDRLQRMESAYREVLTTFSSDIAILQRSGNLRQLVGVPQQIQSDLGNSDLGNSDLGKNAWAMPSLPRASHPDLRQWQGELSTIERLAKSIQADQQWVRQEFARQLAARTEALQRRSILLLEGSVASELKFE